LFRLDRAVVEQPEHADGSERENRRPDGISIQIQTELRDFRETERRR